MNRVRVKLDENLSRSHAELLQRAGYEVHTVHDEGLSGAADKTLWARVVEEGRFLVTLDLDFSDVRAYAPGTHPGVLLIRARGNGAQAVSEVLERCLREAPLEQLKSCLAVADERLTRVRRPPS